jgi:hypothetical protein
MAGYRIQITAQLSPWSALDEARVRATTGAIVTAVAPDIARIELRCDGADAGCAAERALGRVAAALGPSVRFMRPAVWAARRRGPLGLGRRTTGRWAGYGDDDDGLGGVREPRRPAPSAGSAAAAIDPHAA